jgi:hypothetical protein
LGGDTGLVGAGQFELACAQGVGLLALLGSGSLDRAGYRLRVFSDEPVIPCLALGATLSQAGALGVEQRQAE